MSGTLAVDSQSGQSLSFFDLSTGERTEYLSDLIAEPHEMCFDQQRNLLYISHTYRHGHFWAHGDYAHEISVIDCTTREIIEIIDVKPALGPHGLALDRQRDILYASVEEVGDQKGGGLIGIDLKTRTTIKSIESRSKPHWFVMTPDGRKAYMSNKTQTWISVLDLIESSFGGKIEVPGCEEPGISPDGKFAYFPTPGVTIGQPPADASIKVVDTATDKIVNSFPTDLGPQGVLVTPLNTIMVGKYQFDPKAPATSPKALAGRLALYSADTYVLLGEVETDQAPLTMRCTEDGKTAFVANILVGTVSVVDLTTMKVVRILDVDTKPDPKKNIHLGAHGMAVLP